MIFPDWNSLESVRSAHSDLEGAALVFFALLVVFDVLAHFAEENKIRGRLFEKIGLCCFAVAVLAEIVAYPYGQRNDALSAQIIRSLDTTAQEAASNASIALTDSRTALSQAEDALSKTGASEGAMKNAANEASTAQTASLNALSLAQGARTEADSFEKDIVSAKTQAAEAESHLADSLQRAAAAEARVSELNGKLADRVLTDGQVLAVAKQLMPFAGQEYEVTAYWDSPESLNIANRIYAALQTARWKYNPEGGKSILMGGEIGVMIWTHPNADESTKNAASGLIAALNAEGIEAVERQQNPQNPKTNIININIGAKR
jgi:hypothetical protein